MITINVITICILIYNSLINIINIIGIKVQKSKEPDSGNGSFYEAPEPCETGEAVCFGFGEIFLMEDFDLLIDKTFVLELDDEFYFDAGKCLTTNNGGVFAQDCFNEEGSIIYYYDFTHLLLCFYPVFTHFLKSLLCFYSFITMFLP